MLTHVILVVALELLMLGQTRLGGKQTTLVVDAILPQILVDFHNAVMGLIVLVCLIIGFYSFVLLGTLADIKLRAQIQPDVWHITMVRNPTDSFLSMSLPIPLYIGNKAQDASVAPQDQHMVPWAAVFAVDAPAASTTCKSTQPCKPDLGTPQFCESLAGCEFADCQGIRILVFVVAIMGTFILLVNVPGTVIGICYSN